MKTIKFTAFSILFGLLVFVSSCKKETTLVAGNQNYSKILVTGQDAGSGLKSTLSGQSTIWVAGSDKVGIYSAEARTSTSVAIVNIPFTAATSAASSTFSSDPETMSWGALNSSHTFYAYYPYTAGSAANTVVPVSLASAQTQSAAGSSAHIGALDFMVATPVTVTSPATLGMVGSDINLRYNHLFTILEFQIKGSGVLKAVKFSGSNTLAFSGGTIDITQATPGTDVAYTFASQTGTTTEAVVTLTTPATLTATYADTKVYMVINPGTHTGNWLIGLSADGTAWTYISKAAPTGGFLRGEKYVVSIDQSTAFGTVTSNGQIWMDRNLGATRVATSSTDAAAYGDLYQWGRGTDGHQIITSTTTSTLSSGDAPGNAYFITTASSPYDWRSPQNNNLWQGVNGVNNPCPPGFRIPTNDELSAERATWITQNAAGAFGSPLKLTVAGVRTTSGVYSGAGFSASYWTSSVNNVGSGWYGYVLDLSSSSASTGGGKSPAWGLSVRCIKN